MTEAEAIAKYRERITKNPPEIPVEEILKDDNGNPIIIDFGRGIKRNISVITFNSETQPMKSGWTCETQPDLIGKHDNGRPD